MAKKNVVLAKREVKEVRIGNLDLELSLSARNILKIERKMNESLINLLHDGTRSHIPPTNKLLLVFFHANTKAGITEKMLIEAFEEHIDGGGTTMDIFVMFQTLLVDEGFFGSETQTEEEELLTLDVPEETIL